MNKYEKVIGKEVVYINTLGRSFDTIVAGCDPDIGITLVSATDPEDRIYCLNCQLSPVFKRITKRSGDWAKRVGKTNKAFKTVFKGIQKGLVNGRIVMYYIGESRWDGNISARSCAFNQ